MRKLSVFYSSKNWSYFEGGVEGGHSFTLHFLCEQYGPGCVLFWGFFGGLLTQLKEQFSVPVYQAPLHTVSVGTTANSAGVGTGSSGQACQPALLVKKIKHKTTTSYVFHP